MRKPTKRKPHKSIRAQQMLDKPYPGLSPPPPTAAETLTIRQSTHGDFFENARVMQGIKQILRSGGNWYGDLLGARKFGMKPLHLTDVQAEAIEMIVVKLGRIVTGDPDHADNWLDIEGYARLARERLK